MKSKLISIESQPKKVVVVIVVVVVVAVYVMVFLFVVVGGGVGVVLVFVVVVVGHRNLRYCVVDVGFVVKLQSSLTVQSKSVGLGVGFVLKTMFSPHHN